MYFLYLLKTGDFLRKVLLQKQLMPSVASTDKLEKNLKMCVKMEKFNWEGVNFHIFQNSEIFWKRLVLAKTSGLPASSVLVNWEKNYKSILRPKKNFHKKKLLWVTFIVFLSKTEDVSKFEKCPFTKTFRALSTGVLTQQSYFHFLFCVYRQVEIVKKLLTKTDLETVTNHVRNWQKDKIKI